MSIESPADLAGLKRIGKIVAETLLEMVRRLRPGMTTAELDQVGAHALKRHGARSTPGWEYGFPGTACISINDEAVHGIPGNRLILPGDVVKIDLEADAGGYVADAARTVVLPPVSSPDLALARCARSACHTALRVATAGNGVREIGKQVEREVTRNGFSVIPQLTGHGVGRRAHEPPTVPNFDDPECRDWLHEGLVITVEPVISRGSGLALETGDGWTVKTLDGSRSAHHEETIVITGGRPILLTTICPT